jgi:hypothetical protein
MDDFSAGTISVGCLLGEALRRLPPDAWDLTASEGGLSARSISV